MYIDNFIGQKQNALTKEQCEEIIAKCRQNIEATLIDKPDPRDRISVGTGDEQFGTQGKLGRHDYQVYMPREFAEIYAEAHSAVIDGYLEYGKQVSSALQTRVCCPTVKFQWTPVGGGFSVWHSEQGGGSTSNRYASWIIYLNDVEEGGDTEFLYQHQKCKPEQGKLVIWPAGYTHPHRGNPPYSGDKYVLTGWLEVPQGDVYDQAIKMFHYMKENGKI